MGKYDTASTTTTDFDNNVTDYSVDSVSLDEATSNETIVDFSEFEQNIGYYKSIPQLKSSIDQLALWTIGMGWKTASVEDEVKLSRITGWGQDSFDSIMRDLLVLKKVNGDSFAEVIRSEKGNLINLKKLSPSRMRIIVDSKGIIVRYEQKLIDKSIRKLKKSQILHLCNDRIGGEIHGTSAIEACKWVIDAHKEAMVAKRMVINRSKALGIAYYETDNTGKISYINGQIEDAVKNGEMLGLPKDMVEIKEYPTKNLGDILQWIQYLENFFYQIIKVPRVIATSEGLTEAGSKTGYMTFEPVYTSEQRLLEQDIWNQLGIRIKFTKPPSLRDNMQEDEEKNTGQTSIQPKEAGINMERE